MAVRAARRRLSGNIFRWQKAVRDEDGLTPTDKCVAFVLSTYFDRDGRCYPSVGTIAEKCDRSERTVQGSLTRLVDAGLLRRSFRTDDTTLYGARIPRR